jgi:hypothetical protein
MAAGYLPTSNIPGELDRPIETTLRNIALCHLQAKFTVEFSDIEVLGH